MTGYTASLEPVSKTTEHHAPENDADWTRFQERGGSIAFFS
jgi:hypothetical protein